MDKKKALKNLTLDGIAAQGRVGITANYLIPFALALGAGNQLIGILTALPHLMGIIFQPLSSKIVHYFNNKKLVTFYFSILHRLFWIPMIMVPLFFDNGIYWLLLFYAISSALSHIATTSWTSWMIHLVPEKIRGTYFGKRNMLANSAAFVTSLAAGWFLGIVDNLFGFLMLFLIATLIGMFSNYYLSKIPDIKSKAKHHFHFSFKKFFEGYKKHDNYSNFVIFMMFASFSVSIAAPFAAVYMIRELNLSYALFGIAIAIQIIANIVSQPYWGKFSDKFGDRATLVICTSMIPFGVVFFAFANSFWHIIPIQIFAGFIFAGFNLAAFNYLLDSTPTVDSVRFIGNYRMFSAIGNFFGPLTGGVLAALFMAQTFLMFTGLQLLFLLSFVMRAILAIYMIPRIKPIRVKPSTKQFKNIYLKALVIYPIQGIAHELEHIAHHLHLKK